MKFLFRAIARNYTETMEKLRLVLLSEIIATLIHEPWITHCAMNGLTLNDKIGSYEITYT